MLLASSLPFMAEDQRASAEKWMRHALKEAELAIEEGEVPVGAVFVAHKLIDCVHDLSTGTIVSRGHNLTNRTRNGCQHAEFIALQEIIASGIHRPEDVVLYVTVEPCIMCAHAMILAGVRKAFYGCGNDRFGGCGSVLPVHQEAPGLECIAGVLADESIALLKGFYAHENPNAPIEKRKLKPSYDAS